MTTDTSPAPRNAKTKRQLELQAAEQWLSTIAPETASLIESAWQAANTANGNFASDFYEQMFAVEPEVVSLFPGDMTEQGQRLTHTLGEVVALVREPRHLMLLLQATGVRHGHYRVKPVHFDTMGTVLMDVLARRGKETFTEAHRNAWTEFYSRMSVLMRHHLASD